jgi:uncharacterized membrane protein HdeD (DUF308 family)
MSAMKEHINIWELLFWGAISIVTSMILFFLFTRDGSSLTTVEAISSITAAITAFMLTGFRSDIWEPAEER